MARDSDAIELDIAGHPVRISSPGKVLFSERGETKLDLVNYYLAMTEPVMRAMGGRPVLMERYPHGAEGSSFFQKRVPDNAPDWLTTEIVSTPNGTTSRALVIADLAHVAWAVNLGCLGFHVWPARATTPITPTSCASTSIPTPGTDFEDARAVAAPRARAARRARHRRLPEDHRASTASTCTCASRRDGIRIKCAPAAVAFARELARRHPDVVTDAWWKEERGQRIFVDFNQNAPHKTVFGAWCVRAASGVRRCRHRSRGTSSTRSIPTRRRSRACPARVAERGDPWADMDAAPQSIEPLLALYDRDIANGLTDAPWPPVYPKMPGEPPRVAPSRAKKPKARANKSLASYIT